MQTKLTIGESLEVVARLLVFRFFYHVGVLAYFFLVVFVAVFCWLLRGKGRDGGGYRCESARVRSRQRHLLFRA